MKFVLGVAVVELGMVLLQFQSSPTEPIASPTAAPTASPMLAASGELGLEPPQISVVAMANADLEAGRSALFADLAAHRIDNTAVSRGLHDLRRAMHVRLEGALGADRTKQLEDRLRDAHRSQP